MMDQSWLIITHESDVQYQSCCHKVGIISETTLTAGSAEYQHMEDIINEALRTINMAGENVCCTLIKSLNTKYHSETSFEFT